MPGDGATLFHVSVGQFWVKDGQVWHIPTDDKKLRGGHRFEIIRCQRDKHGIWCWVFPRTEADQPIVGLDWFQDARLTTQEDLNRIPDRPCGGPGPEELCTQIEDSVRAIVERTTTG